MPLIQRQGGSEIIIGRALELRSWFGCNPLGLRRVVLSTRSSVARIVIGDNVGISGASIVAERSVTIGDRVRMGANSTIVDTDFHPINPDERSLSPSTGATAAVTIEDDVFIGMNVLILKGTTIGRGSVIGAGSVVSGVIPANSVAAGNPVRVIRSIGCAS